MLIHKVFFRARQPQINVTPLSRAAAVAAYGLSGNDYRVSKLSKSYITIIGIIIQSLKSIGQF